MSHNKSGDDQPPADPDELVFLTERELARRFGLSVKWTQAMRLRGDGVPYHKFGGKHGPVRYRLSDVKAYERRCLRSSTSDEGAQQSPIIRTP